MCEEQQSECVTSVCLRYSLVLCISVSDVMLLTGVMEDVGHSWLTLGREKGTFV